MSQINVVHEPTPNPQSMKFVISQQISEETANFTTAQETYRSPLANKIFGFPWTDGIFIGKDYVTVTKQNWVEWDVLAEPLAGLIKEHLESGLAVLQPAPQVGAAADGTNNDSPIVRKIKKVLDEEIRPSVAMDGGDIVFSRYENNIVYIFMQGACSGCPSSTYTLKMGIETRLREAIPEIKEVVSL